MPILQEIIDSTKGKVKLVIEIKLNGHKKSDVTKIVLELIKKIKLNIRVWWLLCVKMY